MFRFKQFSVGQTGCAMKINTDGVLLGAIADTTQPQKILDIGTGTGVIALMLAQRLADAQVDAVEIDTSAAKTAGENFINSPFHTRLEIFPSGFEEFFYSRPDDKYDLVVSNPPFYINSLESPKANKNLAKHADAGFFERLINGVAKHLSPAGLCWLVLPLQTAVLIKELAKQNGLYLQKIITVHSFEHSEPHREILCLGFEDIFNGVAKLVIYESKDVYSQRYKTLLQPYFLNF